MMIQRDDLVAAAALGLLQYRQIDPLLIFLLQRDVQARREALMAEGRPARPRVHHTVLSWLTALLALVTAALFTILFAERATASLDAGVVAFITLLYSLSAFALIFWFKKLGFGIPTRIASISMLTMVSAAVLALQ